LPKAEKKIKIKKGENTGIGGGFNGEIMFEFPY
jgi:hypothetical protein